MVNPRGPDDRFANDPYTTPGMSGMPPRSPQQLDADLQPDPELDEGRSSTGKVAVFALGIAILLAAVFYGLNNSSSTNQASNPPPTQSAQTQPATSSGNKAPGVTTGAATNRPATPSQQGGSDVNQSAPPPAGQKKNTH
jgi:hypothetical protein